MLSKFHKIKKDLEIAKEKVKTSINQGKQHFNEIIMKITIETKRSRYSNFYYILFFNFNILHFIVSAIKRQLDCSQGFFKELTKYEQEQEITFNICNQKKSEAKHYKKKLLNDQQKRVIISLSLLYNYIFNTIVSNILFFL